MWLIVGTTPKDLPCGKEVVCASYDVCEGTLRLQGGINLTVERGTEALAAAAWHACTSLGTEAPLLLLATDRGSGEGSRAVYAYLTQHAHSLAPSGITFHYLFPDVDWHNRVLMAVQALVPRPLLVADAGFMYVAKMSGYADAYDLFTPDAGEMAFLADEKAPHPFYTRGFLLESKDTVDVLLARARAHGNVPRHLLIKGEVDYIVSGEGAPLVVDFPSTPAMEAIGGTGDLVTGLVTAFLAAGYGVEQAALHAARTNRTVAALARPTPATQVGMLLTHMQEALRHSEDTTRSSFPQ